MNETEGRTRTVGQRNRADNAPPRGWPAGRLRMAMSVGLVAVLALGFAPGAEPAYISTDDLQAAESAHERAVEDVRAKLAETSQQMSHLRTTLASGGLGEILGEITSQTGAAGSEELSLPSFTNSDLQEFSSLPDDLRGPVSQLALATRAASDILGTTDADELRASPDALGALPSREQGRIDSRQQPRLRGGSTSGDPRALAILTSALDDAMPTLTAWAEGHSDEAHTTPQNPTDSEVDRCDVVDDLPYLCVSSEADNANSENAVLLIDLGGDDTYTNTAGGAPFMVVEEQLYLNLSVNIDLGGNDTYASPPDKVKLVFSEELEYWFRVAQGAGILGGVGILIDEAGDDRYEAVGPDYPRLPGVSFGGGLRAEPQALLVAQGAARSGTGILLDRSGSDTYSAEGNPTADGVHWVIAQGAFRVNWFAASLPYSAGSHNGPALLIDLGGNSDTYRADAGRSEFHGRDDQFPARRFVSAQGAAFGVMGVGVLLDDGGVDESFTIQAEASSTDPDLPAQTWIYGQGVSTSSEAMGALLTGSENEVDGTRYRVSANLEGFGQVELGAQGFAYPGRGILDDVAGDDTYEVSVRRHLGMSGNITEAGLPQELRCYPPNAHGSEYPCSISSHANIYVQGVGRATTDAIGAMIDRGGDDVYEVADRTTTHYDLGDARPTSAGSTNVEVEGLRKSAISAQGVGNFGTLNGGIAGAVNVFGSLHDLSGTDAYRVHSTTETDLSVTSEQAQSVRPVAVQNAKAWLLAQGAAATEALGALVDETGDGDRFEVVEATNVSTTPGGLERTEYTKLPYVQGSGLRDARGIFLAGGSNSVVTSSPATPVCPLTQPGNGRGNGTWFTCWLNGESTHSSSSTESPAAVGFGTAEHRERTVPTIKFETPQSSPGSSVEVPARLTAADGTPLAGEVVHFLRQQGEADVQMAPGAVPRWWAQYRVSGMTDEDGRVVVRLPCGTASGSRVLAIYDGTRSASESPAFEALPLKESPC